jgi:hypothetical protein
MRNKEKFKEFSQFDLFQRKDYIFISIILRRQRQMKFAAKLENRFQG